MKKMWIGAMFGAFFLLITTPVSFAGTLQEDYKAVVEKRRDLEKKRIDYEKRQDNISVEMNQITKDLNECIYETRKKALKKRKHKIYESWRMIWESRLKEAEMARRSMEEARRSMVQLWREIGEVRKQFENRRQDIENRHTYKGPGTAYEKEFRAYMEEMEQQYFKRIENELFDGYEEYLRGARGYLNLLTNSLDMCRKNELGVPEDAVSQ